MLAAGLVLAVGAGCGGGGDETTEGNNAPAPANRPAAVIPVAGGHPSTPAPQFSTQAPSVPTGGVTLEELHRQGKTDVVR